MNPEKEVTRILFIDDDELSFQFRQCMVSALHNLPPIEMYYARDATEALSMLEEVKPDVIVLDHEQVEERELFLESLNPSHPPVVIQADKEEEKTLDLYKISDVTIIPRDQSLAGVHKTLLTVATIGARGEQTTPVQSIH